MKSLTGIASDTANVGAGGGEARTGRDDDAEGDGGEE